MYQLIEQNLQLPSDLTCKFFIKEKIKPDTTDVLVVSFYGEYANGSDGKIHGRFIAQKTIEGLMTFDADAIVLDFREMTYNYGNTLLKVFEDISQFMDAGNEENEPSFPVLVICSEKSKNGVLSLLRLANSNEIPDWYFEDLEKALKSATEKGKFWLDN